ncbi:MAG: hypothetical protein ACTFAK_13400 [Candidatus Electronema sp. VV]
MKKREKKQSELRKISASCLLSDEEYKVIFEAARQAGLDVDKWANLSFRLMLDEFCGIGLSQLAEHGVMFADASNCTCPDCLSKLN